MTIARLIAVVLSLAAGLSPAHALTYNFSYQFRLDYIIEGVLLGTPESDPNIIAVDAIVGIPTFNGVTYPSADILTGYRSYADDGTFSRAYVSLDGTFIDLFIVNSAIERGFFIDAPAEQGIARSVY